MINRYFTSIMLIVSLALLFAMAFSCAGGEDDAIPEDRGDDGQDPMFDDDDSGDDDDDTSADDDDDVGPDDLRITAPGQGQIINGTLVDFEFEYSDTVENIILKFDNVDITHLATLSDGVGTGVISGVAVGEHSLYLSGTNGDDLLEHTVVFSTIRNGPYIELTLSSYQVDVGEIITATWIFYDENLDDATDQVGVDIIVDNGAQVMGTNQVKLNNIGTTNVTVKCLYEGDHYSDSHEVLVGDFNPPTIIINGPERGTFTQNSNIIVHGKVIDGSGVAYLKIKSLKEPDTAWTEIPVDGNGNFSHTYFLESGMNTIQFLAADDYDNQAYGNISVLYGLYNADGAELTDSVGIRINQQGFDSIVQVAEDLINSMDFVSLLPPNPVVNEVGTLITLKVDVDHENFSVGPIDINLASPADGELAFSGSVGAIYAEVRIYGDIFDKSTGRGIDFSDTIEISANGATIGGKLVLSVIGGDVFGELTDVTTSISGFQIELFPEILNFVNDFVSDAIENLFLEDFITQMIYDEAAPLIEDAIYDLNNSLNMDLDILGYAFDFNVEFESLTTENDGVSLWATVQVEADDPEGPPKEQPGSYKTTSYPPELNQFVPGTSTAFGFGAILDDDLLNQTLYEAYQSGLLSLGIDADTAPDLGFDFNWRTSDIFLLLLMPQLAAIHPDAPVAIQLRPQIMPLIKVNPDGPDRALDESEIASELQFGDFLIDFIVVHPTDGDIIAFTLALALYMPVTISVDSAQNSISMIFSDDVITEIHVIYEEVNINEGAFEQFIPLILEFVYPLLSGILEDFPIPSFEGYTFAVDALVSTGTRDDWLGLFGDLTGAQ